MVLTAEQRVVLTARLAEAEKAYHELQTGQQARVLVDQSGERIEFTPATASRLAAYITDLKRQLGMLGISSTGPMGYWF